MTTNVSYRVNLLGEWADFIIEFPGLGGIVITGTASTLASGIWQINQYRFPITYSYGRDVVV